MALRPHNQLHYKLLELLVLKICGLYPVQLVGKSKEKDNMINMKTRSVILDFAKPAFSTKANK